MFSRRLSALPRLREGGSVSLLSSDCQLAGAQKWEGLLLFLGDVHLRALAGRSVVHNDGEASHCKARRPSSVFGTLGCAFEPHRAHSLHNGIFSVRNSKRRFVNFCRWKLQRLI